MWRVERKKEKETTERKGGAGWRAGRGGTRRCRERDRHMVIAHSPSGEYSQDELGDEGDEQSGTLMTSCSNAATSIVLCGMLGPSFTPTMVSHLYGRSLEHYHSVVM